MGASTSTPQRGGCGHEGPRAHRDPPPGVATTARRGRRGGLHALRQRPGGEALSRLAAPREGRADARVPRVQRREWESNPCGPYLVVSRDTGRLLGSSGLAFDSEDTASTGYVFAKDAWGYGYATETLRAIVEIARGIGVTRLYALCPVDHAPSWRVLEKSGFTRVALLRGGADFPNLEPDVPRDVLRYGLALDADQE